ncbi:WD40 repeat domain-containing protein [Microbispora sp. CA-135349]|uniref:WD40 repeat domain-containing protein n=1 Tax=Microbispora sp. CA-135349 TaxID=3239953 RepID=UPI003D91A1DB
MFSPDGRILAVGTAGRTVLLWDVHDPGHPTLLSLPLREATSPVFAIAFSPDGRTLATADNAIRFWDVTDPHHPTPLAAPLTGPDRTIWSLAFAPDGRTLAAGTGDGNIWLWATTDPHHPTLLATLPAHNGSVYTVAFDTVDGILVSGGADRTTHLWNIDAGRVAAFVCATAGDRITPSEWARYVPDKRYQPPC